MLAVVEWKQGIAGRRPEAKEQAASPAFPLQVAAAADSPSFFKLDGTRN
jgi:hypothetical protein